MRKTAATIIAITLLGGGTVEVSNAQYRERVIRAEVVTEHATSTNSAIEKVRVLERGKKAAARAREVVDRRSDTSYTIDNGDGTYTAVFYEHPIHERVGNEWYAVEDKVLDKVDFDRRTFSPLGALVNAQTTFYPSLDGYVRNDAANPTWTTVRNATSGTAANDALSSGDEPYSWISGGNYNNRRTFYLFDTSSIPDTDTITAATFSLYKGAGGDNADSASIELVQTNPASDSALATGDYDAVTFTSGGTKTIASFSGSAYNDLSMNATGLTWISKTGLTKLGLITSLDLNNVAPTGLNGLQNVSFSETGGTSQDPKLVVTYAPSAATSVVSDVILFE